jgi:predicted nucleic acid-binding protein
MSAKPVECHVSDTIVKRGSKRLLQAALSEMEAFPLDAPADLVYRELRHRLKKSGRPITAHKNPDL